MLFLGVIVLGLGWLLSRRSRWPFLVGQLATLGASISFLLDSTSGEPEVPAVLALASATAIVLGCLPPSWNWMSDSRAGAARHAEQHDDHARGWADDEAYRWAPPESDSGPIDPNPGSGHGASPAQRIACSQVFPRPGRGAVPRLDTAKPQTPQGSERT